MDKPKTQKDIIVLAWSPAELEQKARAELYDAFTSAILAVGVLLIPTLLALAIAAWRWAL